MPPRRVPISPDIEKLIQEACTQLRAQAKPNISDVIREIKAHTGVALPYHTVRNHFRANTSPLDRLTSAGSFSPLRQRKCSLIGSLSSQTLATPLAADNPEES
jgi:hypothetical protein